MSFLQLGRAAGMLMLVLLDFACQHIKCHAQVVAELFQYTRDEQQSNCGTNNQDKLW